MRACLVVNVGTNARRGSPVLPDMPNLPCVLTWSSVIAVALGAACTDDGGADAVADLPAPILPATPLSYDVELPASFDAAVRAFDNTPADNPITDAGATLGRVLFFDRRLSQGGEVSCASCHKPAAGFSDDRAHSEGFAGEPTRRNSMPVMELRYYRRAAMFWDERASSLEAQALVPIESDIEMGMTLDALVARLAATDYYPPLFAAAFGDPAITSDRIAKALAQFERSIVSYRSPWDAGVAAAAGDVAADFPNFTAEQNRGKQIFFGQHDPSTRGLCGTCHLMANPLAFRPPGGPGPQPTFDNTAVFFMIKPASNGLFDDTDDGYGETTGVATDNGAFKVPSLRNVALTAPYMHDGRFATLADVVDYYDHGVGAHPNLDPALRGAGGAPLRLNLSAADRAALVAFLGTLTDPTVATEARWSDPFPAR
jgi:cytochrome c peroxidase